MSSVTARPASPVPGYPGLSASRNKSGASCFVICSEAATDKAPGNRADSRSAYRAAGNDATCYNASGSAEVFCRADSSVTNGVN